MNRIFRFFCLLLLLFPAIANAQTIVPAAELLAKINKGEAVSLQNATITGNLDLTKLQNMTLKPAKGTSNEYESKEYISTVTAPVKFTNCTFLGDVLAYFNPNDLQNKGLVERVTKGDEVYNTNFDKEVRFENCLFSGEAAFKYSEFKEQVSFSGSTFKKEALFKYSKFAAATDFSKAKFEQEAVFKYVKFPTQADFQGALFTQEASFKYTAFPKGADFSKAQFAGLADFKYANFSAKTHWEGTAFNGGRDMKYTKHQDSPFIDSIKKEESR